MPRQYIKVTIITEQAIQDGVTRIIESAGALGYSVVPVYDKGIWDVGSVGQRARSDTFRNIKIEVICPDWPCTDRIADELSDGFFGSYSGIVYRDPIEVLHFHDERK